VSPSGPRIRKALVGAAILASLAAAYWAGYRAGQRDRDPQHRALVVVRRTKGDPNSSGASYTWFDIRKPGDAARLRQEEERLRSIGAEFYVAKGRIETTMNPDPDPSRVNSHR
jgi:hypothetical protein